MKIEKKTKLESNISTPTHTTHSKNFIDKNSSYCPTIDDSVTNLREELYQLQKEYNQLYKEKNDKEIYYEAQIEKMSQVIEDLKEENETLHKKIDDQINLYNQLLLNFSEQQSLLESKTIKLTALIERINEFADEIRELKLTNVQLEEQCAKMAIKVEEKNIKKMKIDNTKTNSFIPFNNRNNTEQRMNNNTILKEERHNLNSDFLNSKNEIQSKTYSDFNTNSEYYKGNTYDKVEYNYQYDQNENSKKDNNYY